VIHCRPIPYCGLSAHVPAGQEELREDAEKNFPRLNN